jgi:WD40 repeat protein
MRLPVDKAEVILEENSTGLLKVWIQRSVFPISPHQLDDLDLLRLSDRLLEAALDPGRFLDRVGRVNLSISPPPFSMDETFRMVRSAVRQNVYAMEAYLQTKRKASIDRMPLERQIKLPNQSKARAIAFDSKKNTLIVATYGGAAVVRLQDWKISWLYSKGSYEAVDVSSRGDIAIGSYEGRITIFGYGGGIIADSISPYSWIKRLGSAQPLKKVVWSPAGNMLVCFGKDAVWMYEPAAGQFTRWDYPVEWKWNSEYGGRFTCTGRELVVYANGKYVWVVGTNDWKVRGGFDVTRISGGKYDVLSLKHQPVVEPTFDMINDIDVRPQGDILACAGNDGQIMLYDLKTLKTTRLLVGHNPINGQGFPTTVQQIKFSPKGRLLASAGTDDRVVVWDTGTWEPVYGADLSGIISHMETRVLAWSPDSKYIMGCSGDGEIHVWRNSSSESDH